MAGMFSLSKDSAPLRPVRTRRRGATLRAVIALMLREMSTTYGRSPGGYVWAVLEPAAGIGLLTVIFLATGFRTPPLGDNFALFYASGLLPLFTFQGTGNKLMSAINFSKSLLAYPSITYVDALLGRFLLNYFTQVMVAILLLGVIVTFSDTKTVFIAEKMLLAYAMLAAMTLGIGTLNCFLASMYPVWQQVWSIATRPLFIISGIFFLFDSIPQPYQDWLWWNPLIHVIGASRSAFYVGYDAAYVSPLYVFLVSGITGLTGLVFLHRYNRDILYR